MSGGGWDLALEAQDKLADAITRPDGMQYMVNYANSLIERGMVWNVHTHQREETGPTEWRKEHVQSTMAAVIGHQRIGDPVWVSRDVVDLIEAAADPDLERPFKPQPVYLDDLFIPNAFVLLERPLCTLDTWGRRTAFRAISWGQMQTEPGGKPGVLVALWSHRADEDDYGKPNELPIYGGSPLLLSTWTAALYGSEAELEEPSTFELLRRLQILWTFAKQEIAIPVQARVMRSTWRKKSNWRQIKEVTVLTLRRLKGEHEGDGDGEGGVEWDHRWMVSGHWRNQPYKIDGKTVHRQIWINPYVKGPEGAPLVIKRRAVELIR